MERLKLSVVIACYNGARTIGQQLGALAAQRGAALWEIVVADNGSTDDSLRVVNAYASRIPNLRVVNADDKRGTAHARNVGARAATGNAIAILDQDDMVASGWLAAITRALHEHDFVACRREDAELNPDWARVARPTPQQRGLIDDGRFLPHGGGCSLAFRREVFDAVGGFDESFRYLDDVDFCYRVQLAGTPLHFVPDALLHYRLRDTLRDIYRQSRNYAEETVAIYVKYLPAGMPRVSARDAFRGIRHRLRQIIGIPRNKGGLGQQLWQIGWLHGYLRGCRRHHTLAP